MLVIRLKENEKYAFIDDMGQVRPVTFLKREYGEMYSFYDGLIPTDEDLIKETPELAMLPEDTRKLVIEKRREELKKIKAFPLDKYEVEEKVIEYDKAEDMAREEAEAKVEYVSIDPKLSKHRRPLMPEEEKKKLVVIAQQMGYTGDLIKDTRDGHEQSRTKQVNDTMKQIRDILVEATSNGDQLNARPADYADARHRLEQEISNAVTVQQEGEVKKLICQVDFAALTETIVLGEDYILNAHDYEKAYSKAYGVDFDTVKKSVEECVRHVIEEEKLSEKSLHQINDERNAFYKAHTKYDDFNVPFIDEIDQKPARDVEMTYRNGFALTLYTVSDATKHSASEMRDGIRSLVKDIDSLRSEVEGISTYDTEKTSQYLKGIKKLAEKKFTLLPWELDDSK